MSSQKAFALLQKGKVAHVRLFSQSAIRLHQLVERTSYTADKLPQSLKDVYYPKIGNRDIVGPTNSFDYDYIDTPDFPHPSVRWAANTPEVLKLREKEKGDWKSLSLEEKKQLYRNTFCQTYAEMEAPTSEWKRLYLGVMYGIVISSLLLIYNVSFLFERPATFTTEHADHMLQSMLAKNTGHLYGVSSRYEKWAKKNE